jgi:tRNA threonylcarbamoyladenosine biosynthesis protein TsaB
MKLLAIDTCTRRINVAVAVDGVIGAQTPVGGDSSGPPRHVEELAPTIKALLASANVNLRDLDAIAVANGPGMFTGLRVGMATACTIAEVLELPMIALSSLEILAYPLREADCDAVVPLLDARRAELYYEVYPRHANGFGASLGCDIATIDTLASALMAYPGRTLLCGDAYARFATELEAVHNASFAGDEFSRSSCEAMVHIAYTQWNAGAVVSASEVHPVYVRGSDAEVNVAKVAGGTM